MKRVLGALCVLACLLGGYGVACAIPIEFSDFVWEPTLLSAGETTTWEHNIKDDGFVPASREKNNIQRVRNLFPLNGKSFSLFRKASISQIGLGGLGVARLLHNYMKCN